MTLFASNQLSRQIVRKEKTPAAKARGLSRLVDRHNAMIFYIMPSR